MARLNERLSIVEEALNKIGKLDELKHWYDLAKAEEMLPFDE